MQEKIFPQVIPRFYDSVTAWDKQQTRIANKCIFQYFELFLQAVHLSSQGVDDVLSVFEHEVLQLLRGFHLLNVLQRHKHVVLSGKIRVNIHDIGPCSSVPSRL